MPANGPVRHPDPEPLAGGRTAFCRSNREFGINLTWRPVAIRGGPKIVPRAEQKIFLNMKIEGHSQVGYKGLGLLVALGFSVPRADLVKGDLIQFSDNGGWCW